MAQASITGGNAFFDSSTGGTGWCNGIYTLDAAPAGTNRFRFAYKHWNETEWVGQNYDSEAMNNSFWFGLRFTNAHLSTVNLPGVNDNGDKITEADDFLGHYSGQGEGGGAPGYISISSRLTIGGVYCWWYDYNGTGFTDMGHWFSYAVPDTLKVRVLLPNTFYTDAMNIPDGPVEGAKRTYGWEVYKHESLNRIYLGLYIDDTSLTEGNLLDVFDGANRDYTYLIHDEGYTSNWIDGNGVMSFPRYFMIQWPPCNVDRNFPSVYNNFVVPAIAYEYLEDA